MPERSPAPLRRSAPRRRSLLRSSPAVRAGVAVTLTAPALAAVLAAGSPEDTAQDALQSASAANDGAAALVEMSGLAERADRASRSAVRTMRPVTLEPRAVDHRWAAAPLNVWTAPSEKSKRLGLVKRGTKLAVTGQRSNGFAEVLLGDKKNDRWVNARYLASSKPKPPKPEPSTSSGSGSSGSTSSGGSGVSSAPCPDGSGIEAGLTSNADVVYRAVCNAFPSLTTYGGRDPHGEHYDGRAIDFMVSGSTGDAIAEYLRANAATFNIRNIIWSQRIWSSERAGEGWRSMSDRGSTTANHYDHVHVSVH